MQQDEQHSSLETLQEIRSIMDRSARFITLSGLSGVWAGLTGLVGAWIANYYISRSTNDFDGRDWLSYELTILALGVFGVALLGAFWFTARKTKKHGLTMWNQASKQMLVHGGIPLLTGGVCILGFLSHGLPIFIAPTCLIFYGMALINASKYTLSDIKYLGLLEVILGGVCMFYPGYGLYFWAAGFGILHILYGLIMWNKYDKRLKA
jgi:hypothetical protein